MVYRNKLRFMWRESFVWLYVVRYALPDCISQYNILRYTVCQYKNTFLTCSRKLYEKFKIRTYMKIYIMYIRALCYTHTHIQTSKTATFLLIYLCNLSGLGETLYYTYVQHMRPKSLKNWLGIHEKDFSDNLKLVSVSTPRWIWSVMVLTQHIYLKRKTYKNLHQRTII